ncbi:helix-turn-helix domain-containing protein [Vagococcus fluvialis]|uniref:helix-turn-helix domain-containing protein n=1 Tax=Vagococcus fluvialis TaxID=2738 RepID=UPI001A8FDC20|nr:helix-turn-helix domain-containing protein [Vagococcus fluvialis]MBO0487005.1 helix-turn-helix domain-containing protein [Vagococcus fluvialis]
MNLIINEESLEKFASTLADKVLEKMSIEQSKEIPEYFSKREAAVYLNIGLNTLERYIKNGLPVHVISDDLAVRLSRRSIDAFMSENMIKGENDNEQK